MTFFRDLNQFVCAVALGLLLGCGQSSTSPVNETHLNYKIELYLECENYWVESHTILKPYSRIFTVYNNSGIITKFMASNLSFQSGNTTSFKPTCDRLLKVKNKWGDVGLVMPNGTLFGSDFFPGQAPTIENNVGIFYGGFERIRSSNPKHKHRTKLGKSGLLDKSGKVLLEPKYDLLSFHYNNKLIAEIEGERFIIDYKGQVQEEGKDDWLSLKMGSRFPQRDKYLRCNEASFLKSKDGLWGVATNNEDWIIPPKYEVIFCPNKEFTMFADTVARAWCFLDKNGSVVREKRCFDSHPADVVTHHQPEKLSNERFESSLLWMKAYLAFGDGKADAPPRYINWGGMSDGFYTEPNFHYTR